MAEVMMVLGTIGAKLMAAAGTAGSFVAANAGTISTVMTAGSTIYGGLAANAAGKVQEKLAQKKGDMEASAAMREAQERRRQTDLILSRQKAVAAASGGGATDESITAIMEKTQAEGDYSAMMDMYNGAVSRADLYAEGATARKEGKSKMWGSFIDAGTTVYGDMERRQRQQNSYMY